MQNEIMIRSICNFAFFKLQFAFLRNRLPNSVTVRLFDAFAGFFLAGLMQNNLCCLSVDGHVHSRRGGRESTEPDAAEFRLPT